MNMQTVAPVVLHDIVMAPPCQPSLTPEHLVIALARTDPDADPGEVAALLRVAANLLDPTPGTVVARHLQDLYTAANRVSSLLVSGFKPKDIERYIVRLETVLEDIEDVLLAAGVTPV